MDWQPPVTDWADRRKYSRYAMKGLGFAIMKSGSNEVFGQIINLSRGGLAFQYFLEHKTVSTAEYLDIMLSKYTLYIEKIRVRTVFDFEIENELPFSTISKRQQSICFMALTDDQKQKVDFLIKNHTIPPSPTPHQDSAV